MGTVTGGGTYYEGDTAILTAMANSGYHFTQWQDGNTSNPRTVTVIGSATYTASFEANPPTQYTITVTSADPTMGTVSGGGTYNEEATATLTATANAGYHFTQWQDGNTSNPRTVTVTCNATYTASFEANPLTQYTITVTSADPTMGTVSGGGTYNEGATATLTATANSGYHFVRWNDNNTEATRTVTVTSDMNFTAYFEADGIQGISNVTDTDIKVYAENGRIHVIFDGQTIEEVGVYDIVGRKVDGGYKPLFDVPISGVYIVKIGDHPACKVVVIR